MATSKILSRAERSALNKAAHAAKRAAMLAAYEARKAHRVLCCADELPEIGSVVVGNNERGTVDSIGRVFPSKSGLVAWVYYTPVPAERAAPKINASAAPKPVSLLRFLAMRGGLRACPDLVQIHATKHFVPGYGRLVRHDSGLTLDRAREAAEEAGYLAGDSYISDLLYHIEEELHGRPLYANAAIADVCAAEMLRQAECDVARVYA